MPRPRINPNELANPSESYYKRKREERKSKDPSKFNCACGNKAAVYKNNSWVCKRCNDIETQMYNSGMIVRRDFKKRKG